MTVNFSIDNVDPAGARFLEAVKKLFCDPAQARLLAAFRAGALGLYYDPPNGAPLLSDIFTPHRNPPTPNY